MKRRSWAFACDCEHKATRGLLTRAWYRWLLVTFCLRSAGATPGGGVLTCGPPEIVFSSAAERVYSSGSLKLWVRISCRLNVWLVRSAVTLIRRRLTL